MILKNWWEKDLKDNVICPKLSKHIKTDYLVVGGGIAGLAAAHRLVELSREREVPLRFTVPSSKKRSGRSR